MSTPHICSSCRRNILASIRRHGAGQLHSRSTFVSLANARSSKDGPVSEDILAIGASDDFKNGQTEPKHAVSIRKVRRSREHRTDVLDSLFEEGCGAPSDPKAKPINLAFHSHIETLKGLLANPNESIFGIWEYFTSHLSAQAWLSYTGRPLPLPIAFKPVTTTLLRRLQAERLQSRTANQLPTVTDITDVYASLGLLHPSDWKVLVYDLLQKLSELPSTRDRNRTEFSPELLQELLSISDDIIGAWKVLCKYYSPHMDQRGPGLGQSLHDWKFLSYPGNSDLRPTKLKGGLDEVFLLLWPRCPRPYASSVTSAALVTFALFTDAIPRNLRHINHNNPFILAIARLLVATRCDVKDILKSQAAGDPVIKEISIDWPSSLHRAEAIASRSGNPHLGVHHLAVRPLYSTPTLLSQKLSRALTERDLKQIDSLWAEAKLFVRPMTAIDNKSGHEKTGRPIVSSNATRLSHSKAKDIMPQELCDQFILSYMGLRQPDQALDIWNYMIDMSRHPTLSTWHAMLEGCRRARNPTSLEAVWTKLRSSALPPDVACWRTRISCHIECGNIELAIRALEEMGRNWREAAKKQHIKSKSMGDINGIVKPTIETINDTISGLLNRGHHNAAKRILAWGDDFGIKADIVTFNILIRGLVRDGRIQAVPSLLAEMQKQGIQADVATFTTILEETFKISDPLSSEEQLNLTNLVFTEMEAAGVQPNRFTYNKIIFSLLQTHPKDMKAVQAVLARMATQKIEPSRDIYTMLIKHFFSQDPPDLEGVRSLLDRIRVSGTILDHIFWDRVIEGYASVGDTANALAVLGRVDKKGSRVGWPALEMVLRALVENGEWEMAGQVVRNVKLDRGGPPDIDQKGVEGQHSFWRLAGELGLMDAFSAG
jgi:pentatricopeptide repeat protein